MSDQPENPRTIHHPVLGRLEVVDDSDPSLLTVRNELGNTLRIGKRAAGWRMPEPAATVVKVDHMDRAGRPPAPSVPARRPPPAAVVPASTETTQRRSAMEPKVIEFAVERETKNTVRYEEQTDGQPPAVGTLYVQKWALGSPAPPKLRVTIESAG